MSKREQQARSYAHDQGQLFLAAEQRLKDAGVRAQEISLLLSTGPAPESVMQEAQRIINGPRRESYGHPRKNFADTAAMFSVILNIPVTSRQVAQCMIALKLCRDVKKAARDNLVDICGYAGCAEAIEQPE